MKKLLLIPAMMLATASFADQYKYELSPMIGYNFAEGNLGFKNDGYLTGGLEVQANSASSKLSPEFSIFYAYPDYKTTGSTNVVRGAFNGVYTFDKKSIFTPFAKLGFGYESISDKTTADQNGFFADAGAGAKVALTDNLALKLEAVYMAKLAEQNAGKADSNLMTLVGLNYAFGGKTQAPQQEEVVEEAVVVAPVVVAEQDDDNDGVANSKDKCANTPAGTAVNAQGCAKDSDKDGVIDILDICPNTPANSTVDAHGCIVVIDSDNDGIADVSDKCPNTPAGTAVNAQGCPKDSDGDGVVDSLDKCPNTPKGIAVDANGCPITMTLHIDFANNSYKVASSSDAELDKFADFLKKYKDYSTQITGYTDNKGSASYNKKLSKKRADEVKKLLVQRGVDASRIQTIGMGELNPIASNATPQGRAKNRRIVATLDLN